MKIVIESLFVIQTNKKALPFLTELTKYIPKYTFLF